MRKFSIKNSLVSHGILILKLLNVNVKHKSNEIIAYIRQKHQKVQTNSNFKEQKALIESEICS